MSASAGQATALMEGGVHIAGERTDVYEGAQVARDVYAIVKGNGGCTFILWRMCRPVGD